LRGVFCLGVMLLTVGLPVFSAHGKAVRPRHRKARAKKKPKPRKPRVHVKKARLFGGLHYRIQSRQGVLHVWKPRGFRRKKGGVVVYVHGYRSSADKSFKQRGLVEQFAKSRQNALFIIADGPASKEQRVKFPALGKILHLVARYARIHMPHGHIVAIGHSAAYRTIVNWLDYRYLDHIVLVDALYGRVKQFKRWMTEHKYKDWHKLIVISHDTLEQTARFLNAFKYVVKLRRFPGKWSEFSKRQRRARLLFIRSQFGHSQLVTSKRVIPLLLRLTRLQLL
jgi:hypothetical protein